MGGRLLLCSLVFLGAVLVLSFIAGLRNDGAGDFGEPESFVARVESFCLDTLPDFLGWKPAKITTAVSGNAEDAEIKRQLARLQQRGLHPLRVEDLPCSFVNKAPMFSQSQARGIPELHSVDEYRRYMDYCMARGYDEARFCMVGTEMPVELNDGSYFLISHELELVQDNLKQNQSRVYSSSFFYTDFYHMLRAVHNPQEQWLGLTQEELATLRAALQMLNAAMDRLDAAAVAPTFANKAFFIQQELACKLRYHEISDTSSVFYMNRSKFIVYAMRGDAICEGYSVAYGFLLALAGIQSVPVSGVVNMPPDAKSGGYHEWNMVKLEGPGQWYHVDATWNDQGCDTSTEYFLLTDEQMRNAGRGRTWGKHPVPSSATVPFSCQ